MKKLFIILTCSIGILFTTDCERNTSSVYSNVTGEAFPADNVKDYRGYNPHKANDTLYRRYERSDSFTTSDIYNNSKSTRVRTN